MPPVRRVDIKTGFSCNNRCRFCVQGDKRDEYSDKSTDEVRDILELARADADEVVFTGGEVTIRPDVYELVAHAHALDYRIIQIQTNGRMLSSTKVVDRLIEAGATEFSPALHGPNADIHDGLTRAKRSFRQTVRGIMNVKKRGRRVLVNCVITRANYRFLPAMARLLVRLGVDQFQFAFVHPLGTAAVDFDRIVPRLVDVAPHVARALDIGSRAGVVCMTEAIPLCFLRGREQFAAERIIPRTKIFDATWIVEDYTTLRLEEGKLKGPPCVGCVHDSHCEGPWREYPERRGWAEFEPV